MSRHEVKRIYRRTESIYSNVEFIGGDNKDGSKWKIPVERAIDGILTNKWEFFVVINDYELDLTVQINQDKTLLCLNFPEIGNINISNIIIHQYCG